MTTTRGTVLFGNQPEVPTQASHFHIMKDDPNNVDLFFGDDFNYVKLPSTQGVEISADGNSWQFGTDGNLILPQTNMQSSPAPVSLPGITFTDGTFQKTAATGNTLVNGEYTVSLGADGALVLPVGSVIQTSANIGNVVIEANNGISSTWIFSGDGGLTFSDGGTLRVKGTAPSTARGAVGDRAGMIAFSQGNFYHCYADYVDGITPIWSFVAMNNTDWD
jgi:hypothetical protein